MADEAKELNLLKNVENRIVFAQNDTALQSILKTFLCPMLLKLESPNASVRDKTVSICQHINTRIKPSAIQLPVAALLAQFQTPNAGVLLKNFDLMYIQRGLERVSADLVNLGEDGLKKLSIDLDRLEIEDTTKPDEKVMRRNDAGIVILQRLYDLYLGIPEPQTPPVKPSLKVRIVNILFKSLLALKPEVVAPEKVQQVVEEGLSENPEYNFKFRSSVFSFLVHLTRLGGDDIIKTIGYSIIENIQRWIHDDGWPRSTSANINQASRPLRSQGYVTIGLLSRRVPDFVVLNDLQILRFLLSAVRGETKDMRSSAEEAISSILPGLSLINQSERNKVKGLAYENLLDDSDTSGWNEGKKALHPYWFSVLHPTSSNKETGPLANLDPDADVDKMDVDSEPIEEQHVDKPVFDSLLRYLLSESSQTPKAFKIGLVSMKSIHGVPTMILPEMAAFLRTVLLTNALDQGLAHQDNAEETLALDGDWDDKISSDQDASRYFELLLMGLLQAPSASQLLQISSKNKWAEISRLSLQGKRTERETASFLIGTLVALDDSNDEEFEKEWIDLQITRISNWESTTASDSSKTHGSILAIAYYFSHLNVETPYRTNFNPTSDKQAQISKVISAYIDIIIDSRDSEFRDASILGLTQLCFFNVVKPDQTKKETELLEKLKGLGKTGHEKAVIALGALSIIYPVDDMNTNGPDQKSQYAKIKDILVSIHDSKMPELGFATGEALSVLAAGLHERRDGKILSELVSELVEMRSKGGSASFRKAACVWLLSIVEYCGHLDQVRERFEDIHATFQLYLTDREEFVQETASRGLTKVYELGDKSLKEELVRNLVASFTGTTKTLAGQVQADTQLFEPGALPTGDGSISTYKDILSLASEVGDSSLVYKFMSLASHSAMWSSRAAFGRFGLGSIMSGSEEMLAENPKLYAKLFRYRFDPNPNVQRSMNDIWKALGRQPYQYEKHLQNIWAMAFKVLDDIKASVREAAMKLCRTLTKSLIHTVSDEHNTSPKEAKKALDNIMPFLMGSNGLESQAEDAQMLALKTLLGLVKKCGRVLRPYVPDMVEQFLNLLSSLEPQAINYLHLNAAKYNLTEDKASTLDAIERCLDIADADVMKVLVPRLNKAIRKAVGMPSKVGFSRVIVTLVIRHNFLFKPYANDTLRVMSTALVDRNETVSASYAAACGYLARLASDESVVRLLQYSQKLYFEQQEERLRILSASVLNAISKHASDRFQALASDILPFAFVAKHDPEASVAEEYSKCWTDNTGGSGAVKLYLPEITALAGAHLDSARWTIKQTAALSIADLCVVLGPDLTGEQLDVVYPLAVRSVAGKSYPSKAKVLEGFAALCTSPKFGDTQKLKEVSKILLREANRNNNNYRPPAFDSLAKFLNARPETNLYDEVVEIVGNVLDAGAITDEDDMDTDSHGKASERLWQITLTSSFQLLGASLHTGYPNSVSQVEKLLGLVQKQLLPNYGRDVKNANIELVDKILCRLQDNGPSSPVDPKTWNKLLVQLWTNLDLVSRGASSDNEKIRQALKAATEKLSGLMERVHADVEVHNSQFDLLSPDLSPAEVPSLMDKGRKVRRHSIPHIPMVENPDGGGMGSPSRSKLAIIAPRSEKDKGVALLRSPMDTVFKDRLPPRSRTGCCPEALALPPFSQLTTDDERELKATTRQPAALVVVLTQQSFENSEAEAKDSEGRTSPSRDNIKIEDADGSPSEWIGESGRRGLFNQVISSSPATAADPDIVILAKFEEPNPKPPTLAPSATSPVGRRLSVASIRSAGQSSTATSRSSPQLDGPKLLPTVAPKLENPTAHFREQISLPFAVPEHPQAINPNDALYLNFYRNYISPHVFHVRGVGSIWNTSIQGEDFFDLEAAKFPPLFHAMMAVSAFSFGHKNPSANHLVQSLQHYQAVLPALQSRLSSPVDLTSDGILYTHFFLLIYEIAAAEAGRPNLWQQNLSQLRSLLFERALLNSSGATPFIIWYLVVIDVIASLAGVDDGGLTESFLRNNLVADFKKTFVPSAMADGLSIFSSPAHQALENEAFLQALSLNQELILLGSTIARTRVALKTTPLPSEYASSDPLSTSDIQASLRESQVQQILEQLQRVWIFHQNGMASLATEADAATSTRLAILQSQAKLFYHALNLYARTSMWPQQIRETADVETNSREITHSIDAITTECTHVLNNPTVFFNTGFLVFPLFMAGISATDARHRAWVLDALARAGVNTVGRNCSVIKTALQTIYQHQNTALVGAGLPTGGAAWQDLLCGFGVQVALFGF
ncbi:hypothetical protein Dda_3195 [Drechslerella dactyloides]|uniref:Uncharacterized protein n=1 Tax=Drechslerella dactyloides TaxID=74499 RepID=A0AAD6NLA6_DREDA|nr:hypothetical protein Dda_3195 [Drechslerella dactyloides]